MLKCSDLSVRADKSDFVILDRISADFPARSLNALVGPSGCGKTTLIKAFLGLVDSEGTIALHRQNSGEAPSDERLGFVPQFSVAHASLSVEESLAYAFDLTVSDSSAKSERLENVLGLIGLSEHREKRVSSLSGGQMRRLGLGLELVSSPECLICDEVTSGLDPLSEDPLKLYHAYRMGNVSWLPAEWGAAAVLCLHMAVGAAMVWYGCRRKRWGA